MSLLHWHLTHLPSPKYSSAPANNCSNSGGSTECRKVLHHHNHHHHEPPSKRSKTIIRSAHQQPKKSPASVVGIEAIAKKFSSLRKKSQMRLR